VRPLARSARIRRVREAQVTRLALRAVSAISLVKAERGVPEARSPTAARLHSRIALFQGIAAELAVTGGMTRTDPLAVAGEAGGTGVPFTTAEPINMSWQVQPVRWWLVL